MAKMRGISELARGLFCKNALILIDLRTHPLENPDHVPPADSSSPQPGAPRPAAPRPPHPKGLRRLGGVLALFIALGWGLKASAPALVSRVLSDRLGSRLEIQNLRWGWKSIQLEDVTLWDTRSDTLAYVHRVSWRWKSLNWTGGPQQLGRLDLDSAVVLVTGCPRPDQPHATNWDAFVDRLPRSSSKGKGGISLILNRLNLSNLQVHLKKIGEVGGLALNGTYPIQELEIKQLRLSKGRWALDLRTRLGSPFHQGLAFLQGRLQAGTGLVKGSGLILKHPDFQVDMAQVTWQRFSQAPYTQLLFSDLNLRSESKAVRAWMKSAPPALTLALSVPTARWSGDSLEVLGGSLRLDQAVTVSFHGWYAPHAPGEPHGPPQGQMAWAVAADTGWQSAGERLAATIAGCLENPQLTLKLDPINDYVDWSRGWTGEGTWISRSERLELRAQGRIQGDSLRLTATSDASRQAWSGTAYCSKYSLPEDWKAPLTLRKLKADWTWNQRGQASANLQLDTLRWDEKAYQGLSVALKWKPGLWAGQIQTADPENLLDASFQAQQNGSKWSSCQANGTINLTFPSITGWCDGLRARGDFDLQFQPLLPIQGPSDDPAYTAPWLEWTLKNGGLACASHALDIDQAKVTLSGNGPKTQSTLLINRDSVQTLGLERWTQVDSVLQQIGRFLLADTLLRKYDIPFWAYGRVEKLGDYLPFLKVAEPLQAHGIQGYFNWASPLNKGLRLRVDTLQWDTWSAQKISLQSEYLGNHLLVLGSMDSLELNQATLMDGVEYRQIRNGALSTLALHGRNAVNGDFVQFKGSLINDDSLWSLSVDSLKFRSRQQNWKALPGGVIQKNPKGWLVETLNLQSGSSQLRLDGILSQEQGELVHLDIINVDLDQVLALTGQGTGWLDGVINGQITGDGLLDRPNLSGDLRVTQLRMDSLPVGTLKVRSEFQPEINRLLVNASLEENQQNLASIAGWIQTDEPELPCSLNLQLERAPLQLLELVLLPHLDSIRGTARADVHLGGGLNNPKMQGYLIMDSGRLYLPSLKSTYYLRDTVQVAPDRFVFGGNPVTDGDLGTAKVRGLVQHRTFRDWTYRFDLDSVRNLRVLNEPRLVSGDYYYGLGRVSGSASISGDEYLTRIQVKAQAQKGSRLIIPLDDLEEENRYDFIRFADAGQDQASPTNPSAEVALRGLDLNLSLVLTPESEVTLLLDRRYGDQIKGNGNGALDLTLTQEGNLNLSGNYVFTKGDYSFNLGNIASKNFKINDGGRIDWNGDPYEGVMNIQAVYNQRASVQNLLGSNRAQNDRRNMLPVQTQLNLSGPVLNPEVKFQLQLPTINMADPNDALAQQIIRINNNEQELNNQVLGLMVSGQFIPTENINAANLGLSTGATAFNSVTELLTNRLSNLLSNSLGGVNLGINYRGDLGTGLLGSGTGGNSLTDSNRRDLNVALNTSLFNNRLVIDGNLAMGNSLQVNAQNMAGEIQMEYLINPNGTVRARAFNRVDDRILFNQTLNYRQGIGLSYNRNFDRWSELFRQRDKR